MDSELYTRRTVLAAGALAALAASWLASGDDASGTDGRNWRYHEPFLRWLPSGVARVRYDDYRRRREAGLEEIPVVDGPADDGSLYGASIEDLRGRVVVNADFATGPIVMLGEFDRTDAVDELTGAGDYEVVDRYRGYTVVARDDAPFREAVGDDAVLRFRPDERFERYVDARRRRPGNAYGHWRASRRLVESDRDFALLFDALPPGLGINGGINELNSAIAVSGSSSDGETLTVVSVFHDDESAADYRDSRLDDSPAVERIERNGRVLRFDHSISVSETDRYGRRQE